MIAGALVLLYCIIVNVKLGKVRFSLIPACGGLGMILLGALISAFPEQLWVWILQLLAMAGILVLAIVECIVLAGNRLENGTERPCPDYTIVLGCGLRKGNQMPSTLRERLKLAKERYKGERIILSGGQTPRETAVEADVMINWMKENGVPEDRLLAERKSLNTLQNLENCKALIQAETGTDIGRFSVRIITSDFHAGRTRRLAREIGYQKVIVCGSKTQTLIAPMYHLRECLAIVYGILRKREEG